MRIGRIEAKYTGSAAGSTAPDLAESLSATVIAARCRFHKIKSGLVHSWTEVNSMKKSMKPPSAAKEPGKTYQLKIELEGIAPPIWRRVLVPGKISLGRLHAVIQMAMGWSDAHLHQFIVDRQIYSDPTLELNEFGDTPEIRNENRYFLKNLAPRAGKVIVYEYDFGDSWTHRIKVEKILELEPPGGSGARCIDGSRACPPEDCGGVWGYENMLEILKDPQHEEHESTIEWLGGDFDPEVFDLAATNNGLRRL
jgi:hypothetical protein